MGYSLAIELTSYCNQKCGYCYNPWREDGGRALGALESQTLQRLVARALDEVRFEHVTLTGGEPFARTDVFDIIELVRSRGVGVQIISNGGLINDAIAARLAPLRPRFVQVTLNSTDKALHNEHVSAPGGGRDHHAATLAGVEALLRHGVTVAGCIVVTRKNAHQVGAILDIWAGLGVRSIALSRFSPAGYAAQQVAELLPSRSELLVGLQQAEQRAIAHGLDLQVTMPVPPCVVDHADFPHIRFGGCPVGSELQEFALGPDGAVRHCTLHEEKLGVVGETSLASIVAAPRVAAYRDVTPDFCQPCPHKASCLGGCGAAAGAVLGDPRGLDPFVAQHVDPVFAARLEAARAPALVQLGRG